MYCLPSQTSQCASHVRGIPADLWCRRTCCTRRLAGATPKCWQHCCRRLAPPASAAPMGAAWGARRCTPPSFMGRRAQLGC